MPCKASTNPDPAATAKPGAPLTLTQRKRRDVIAAASLEFQHSGFMGATMDAIAARAKVSKRTVYHHFAGKEELFQTVVLELWQEATTVPVYDYRPSQPLEKQLKAIARQEINMLASPEHFALARVVVAECIRSPQMGRRIFEAIIQSDIGFKAWVKSAVAHGALAAPDANLAAEHFLDMIQGQAFWHQVVGGQPQLDEGQRQRLEDSVVCTFLMRFGVDPG